MRTARLKEEGKAYYHCMTRIVGRQFLLDNKEKERLCKLMRNMETFTGIHILTHCFLDNHFHFLMEVPERVDISDVALKQRLQAIYSEDHVKMVMGIIKDYRKGGEEALAEEEKARYTYRMFDISEFMKTYKQKYTQSYNRSIPARMFEKLIIGYISEIGKHPDVIKETINVSNREKKRSLRPLKKKLAELDKEYMKASEAVQTCIEAAKKKGAKNLSKAFMQEGEKLAEQKRKIEVERERVKVDINYREQVVADEGIIAQALLDFESVFDNLTSED